MSYSYSFLALLYIVHTWSSLAPASALYLLFVHFVLRSMLDSSLHEALDRNFLCKYGHCVYECVSPPSTNTHIARLYSLSSPLPSPHTSHSPCFFIIAILIVVICVLLTWQILNVFLMLIRSSNWQESQLSTSLQMVTEQHQCIQILYIQQYQSIVACELFIPDHLLPEYAGLICCRHPPLLLGTHN